MNPPCFKLLGFFGFENAEYMFFFNMSFSPTSDPISSPAQLAMNLPILTCTYCMRKVGMWNFHQMENTGGSEGDAPSIASSPPTTPRPGQEGAGEGLTHTSTSTPTPNLSSPSPSPTLSRMKLRSQDSSRSESVSLTSLLKHLSPGVIAGML